MNLPHRAKMHPTDVDGFREAWDILEQLWQGSVGPLDLHHDEMPNDPSVPRDLSARPSLDQVLRLREDRMATVRRVIAELTEERLAGMTEPVMEPDAIPRPLPRSSPWQGGLQVKPMGQLPGFACDRCRHGLAEGDILVDGGDV